VEQFFLVIVHKVAREEEVEGVNVQELPLVKMIALALILQGLFDNFEHSS